MPPAPRSPLRARHSVSFLAPILAALLGTRTAAGQDPRADPAVFFEAHCVKCHGPDESKGDVTLHDVLARDDFETWELVLDVLDSGEMPPDEERQPKEADRAQMVAWVEEHLDTAVAEATRRESDEELEPTTRRLTNFEYQNTMRDLLGIELDFTERLPKDPIVPYQFNNAARYLLVGLEQIDRYEEAARRAMASVIVDGPRPEPHVTRQVWGAEARRGMPHPAVMQPDELGVFGNRNNTVANGMRVFERPDTGAFRIRMKASAVRPPGVEEVPLAIYLGHDIRGVGVNPAAPAKLVGIVKVTNTVDDPQVFELTGRVEDYPFKPEHRYRRGGKIDGRLVITPPHFAVTPVNVYDDGTLNDAPDPLTRPRVVVEWMEFESPLAADEPWPPAHHTRILFDSPLRKSDPNAYVRAVLERFLSRAFRRPVNDEEIDRYAKVYEIVSEQLGLDTVEAAMRETLALALISPDFLLHTQAGADDQHYAIASRLSYFLWGSMPDDELFTLASQQRLRDPEVVEEQVVRMLADDRADDFVTQFTTQWLSLHRLQTVPINLKRFPRFLYTITRGERTGREISNRPTIRAYMQAESAAFVGELIRRNASVLDIVDSDFAMLNQPLAAHYGVDGVQGHELRPVPLEPEHQLGGLLTHGSVLVGTGTGTAPHPVYRAVWLREAILGDEVPAPPADVPALEDSVGQEEAAEAVTLKDLLRLHRQKESCRDCHARLDPWGVPFENYDATGRYAPRVPAPGLQVARFDERRHADLAAYEAYLDEIATVEIDAASRLPSGVEVDGVEGLKRYLLEERADDVAENVIRRLLTYALGRETTWRDRATIETVRREAEPHRYPLRDLIVGICRSDPFLGNDAEAGNERDH